MTKPIGIFIVEDQAITRLGLRVILEQISAFLILGEEGNGARAVERIVNAGPDVVLLDIGLPGKDGIQVAQELKQKVPAVKVLMLTAQDHDEAVFASLAAGADGYCLKDASVERMVHAIHTIHEGAAWLDPGIAHRVLRVSARGGKTVRSQDSGGQKDKFALSRREVEVLNLVVEGCGNRVIADRLIVSEDTVKTHMRHIMEKLAVADRTQAAVKALREGLI